MALYQLSKATLLNTLSYTKRTKFAKPPPAKITDNSLKYKVIFHTISPCMTHISKIYVRTAKSLNTTKKKRKHRTEQIKYIFDYDYGKERGEKGGEPLGSWVTLVRKQVKLKNSFPTTLDTQIFCFLFQFPSV